MEQLVELSTVITIEVDVTEHPASSVITQLSDSVSVCRERVAM